MWLRAASTALAGLDRLASGPAAPGSVTRLRLASTASARLHCRHLVHRISTTKIGAYIYIYIYIYSAKERWCGSRNVCALGHNPVSLDSISDLVFGFGLPRARASGRCSACDGFVLVAFYAADAPNASLLRSPTELFPLRSTSSRDLVSNLTYLALVRLVVVLLPATVSRARWLPSGRLSPVQVFSVLRPSSRL
jgi:hypothetical protein